MSYVIKAAIADENLKDFSFRAQKTMYGGKGIREKDEIFVFASETQGGPGLIARGVVTAATSVPIRRKDPKERVTPRVSIEVRRVAKAKRNLGRDDLKAFSDWDDGKPETELNFKFYRQSTNKICAISDTTATFLRKFF
jgi:hypothetical protein